MKYLLCALLFVSLHALGQNKKPLDHSVYDGWKSVGERMISNDGEYIVYTVTPQVGDGELVIQNLRTKYLKQVPRGYDAVITEDSRYIVFKIKPLYQVTRQAKINKKRGEDLPKDTLAIVEAGKDSIVKTPRIRSYKTPEKGAGWIAYQLEKPLADSSKKKQLPDAIKLKIDQLIRLADSVINKTVDSVKRKAANEKLVLVLQKAAQEIITNKDDIAVDKNKGFTDAEGDSSTSGSSKDGTELVLRRTRDGNQVYFKHVSEYLFNKRGTRLLMEISTPAKDSSIALVLLYNLQTGHSDTVMKRFNDCKNYVFDEEGNQLSFVAERDSSEKSLQKYYKLWYYKTGIDSAVLLADKRTTGMQLGNTISENAVISFSKDGQKIFFGVAPIKAIKDTSLVDFELARLDVWHYNDDYLQPQQLKQLDQELKRSYLTVIKPGENHLLQLGTTDIENIGLINEGNANYVLGTSTRGSRIQSQWTGNTRQTGYLISTVDGAKNVIAKNITGIMQASPLGKFIYWYDAAAKNYFVYNVVTGLSKNASSTIKSPLYDTKNDVPDNPASAGTTGWTANDQYFLINDEYDIWQVDPMGIESPKNITNGFGRKNNTSFTYLKTDAEKRFFASADSILLRSFNKTSKYAGFFTKQINQIKDPVAITVGPFSYGATLKAKNAQQFVVVKSDISASELVASADLKTFTPLTNIAAQQSAYNWLTVELVKWKMLDGKMSEGLLYKPANFDPKKKYPIIFYFYERNSDGLYNYRAPAPSASTVNVPWFVSNDYLIFDPNIYYTTGEPGQSAFNSVVSAAKYLAKMPWVDSTRMGLQGQSWGGYQVAYLVTKTNLFKAASAGAPVANMTSAYGGIRWGVGISREFQYEKTQTRIGATLWQRPDLYLKNSPLFSANKITTPLLIMHNDTDGSVPWYQGIELFTALRRLGKKAWLLQYNGEDHNLVERKNRKDLSVRLGQFFDYYLKDKAPARWIKDGVPATAKGKDWGLDY